MLELVHFRKTQYKLVVTNHARERMRERGITLKEVILVIEKGKAVAKRSKKKWWVYKKIKKRNDNNICLSLSIESPHLIVITTLIHWRPDENIL